MEPPANPYLSRGVYDAETKSSVLSSTSKYLNSPALRAWIATHYLRRNGPDRPTPSDNTDLKKALAPLRDEAHVNALFEKERAINPVMDRWLTERFVSTFKLAELAQYGPETIAGIYHREMTKPGFDYRLDAPQDPKSNYEFFWTRYLQIHDWVHLLVNEGYNSMGEVVTYWAALSNYCWHLSPELMGELQTKPLLGGLRFLTRSMLHYPETWPTVIIAMEKGIRIGRASGPLFAIKVEDVFHLTIPQAQEALGVRNVDPPIDSEWASAVFDEAPLPQAPPKSAVGF